MVGALTMAAARLACDIWVADQGRGDLPSLMQQHLNALDVSALTNSASRHRTQGAI